MLTDQEFDELMAKRDAIRTTNRVNILDVIEKLGFPYTTGLFLVECGAHLDLGKVMVEQTLGTVAVRDDGLGPRIASTDGLCPARGCRGPLVTSDLVGRCGHDYQLDFGFYEGRTSIWLCKDNKRHDADPWPQTLT